MNSQRRLVPGAALRRCIAAVFLVIVSGLFSSGCARMKQYSVDSWQGPLPMQDVKYVEVDPWTR